VKFFVVEVVGAHAGAFGVRKKVPQAVVVGVRNVWKWVCGSTSGCVFWELSTIDGGLCE
jgi:hypothetical protein